MLFWTKMKALSVLERLSGESGEDLLLAEGTTYERLQTQSNSFFHLKFLVLDLMEDDPDDEHLVIRRYSKLYIYPQTLSDPSNSDSSKI